MARLLLTMTEQQDQIQELRLKRIDTLISVIGAVGVIASICFGFSQLVTQSKAQAKATDDQTAAIKDQWSRRFYDEKLAVYSRATEAAAGVAALKSKGAPESQIEDAEMQFKILYWGPMCITEGNDVETAMVRFQQGVDAGASASQLEQLSLDLAHICRNEAHVLYNQEKGFDASYGSNTQILEKMNAIVRGARATQEHQ